MKLNLTANQTFGSSQFASVKPTQIKTQGLKIRQKKLQTKYKQLIQKHQTMKKFTPNFMTNLETQEIDKNFVNEFIDKDSFDNEMETKTGRVTTSSIKKDKDEGLITKKRYEFLTARDYLQRTQSNNKSKGSLRPSSIKSNSSKLKLLNKNQPKINKSPQKKSSNTEEQPTNLLSPTDQHLITREFLLKLDNSLTCHTNLWQSFLKSVKQIQLNQQMLCLTHVCEKDRQLRLVGDFMKEMDFLLEQQDRKVLEVTDKIKDTKENELKRMYVQTHQLHEKLTQAKIKITQHDQQYNTYLNTLKQQQKQRKLMLQFKRQSTLTKPHTADNSPLRHLHKDLNLNQKDLKLVMEKKTKLNMELDLSFQIQQRKKIAKQKEVFNARKIKLEKEKTTIQSKMKEVKQKISFKEKQVERLQAQKDKLMKEVEYFLKMLLKNNHYRLDGAVWIFRKMIEYGFDVQVSDFSQQLDFKARGFLIEQFKMMKEKQVFKVKPIEKRKQMIKMGRKAKKTANNRQRVKSVTMPSEQQQNKNPITIKDDLNSNLPPNLSENPFFTFGCKNLNPPQKLNIRKKSGSLTLMKTYDESLGDLTESNESRIQTTHNSFRALTKENNRNKLYFSAKKYIKNWISEKGWNMIATRTATKVQDNKGEEKFIAEEKARTKQKFFKIGRSNTRYNSIVKTLYGSQEDLKAIDKRLKTSHQ